MNLRVAQDPEFAQFAAKLYEATPGERNSTELAQASSVIRATLQNLQAHYPLWVEGNLPESNWTFRRRRRSANYRYLSSAHYGISSRLKTSMHMNSLQKSKPIWIQQNYR